MTIEIKADDETREATWCDGCKRFSHGPYCPHCKPDDRELPIIKQSAAVYFCQQCGKLHTGEKCPVCQAAGECMLRVAGSQQPPSDAAIVWQRTFRSLRCIAFPAIAGAMLPLVFIDGNPGWKLLTPVISLSVVGFVICAAETILYINEKHARWLKERNR